MTERKPFRFRQFEVHDDRCSMKVGTDGVLLGAWVDISAAVRVLDIGAGSGIISLMLAQRTEDHVRIDAVEISAQDSDQAKDNVQRSPWSSKVTVYTTAIQDYVTDRPYDLIVSNPPYFVNSLLPPVGSRERARHVTSLDHRNILDAVKRLLTPDGAFCLILPPAESKQFQLAAIDFRLLPTKRMEFRAREQKEIERVLTEYRYAQSNLEIEKLTLYKEGNSWSEEYRTLTKEFYLSPDKGN